MRRSCVTFPAKSKLLIIRDPLVKMFLAIDIGKGKVPDAHCAAAILNQLIYWTDIKLAHNSQAEIENAAAQKDGLSSPYPIDLWVYKSIEDFQDELLSLFGRNKIINCLQWLIDHCLIEKRRNPRYRWDSTLQYRVETSLVQFCIDHHEGLKFNSKLSEVWNQTLKSLNLNSQEFETKPAIPETTTETTTEEKTKVVKTTLADETPLVDAADTDVSSGCCAADPSGSSGCCGANAPAADEQSSQTLVEIADAPGRNDFSLPGNSNSVNTTPSNQNLASEAKNKVDSSSKMTVANATGTPLPPRNRFTAPVPAAATAATDTKGRILVSSLPAEHPVHHIYAALKELNPHLRPATYISQAQYDRLNQSKPKDGKTYPSFMALWQKKPETMREYLFDESDGGMLGYIEKYGYAPNLDRALFILERPWMSYHGFLAWSGQDDVGKVALPEPEVPKPPKKRSHLLELLDMQARGEL